MALLLILIVFAFVLAVIAVSKEPKVVLIAASLAFFYLYVLLGGAFGVLHK
jgi:hypothetical protein